MAAGDYTVLNAVCDLGLNGYTWTNASVERMTWTRTENVHVIKDEHGAEVSNVYRNPGIRLVLRGALLKNASTAVLAYLKGQIITINSVKYMLEELRPTFNGDGTEAKVDMTVSREDSMGSTIGT